MNYALHGPHHTSNKRIQSESMENGLTMHHQSSHDMTKVRKVQQTNIPCISVMIFCCSCQFQVLLTDDYFSNVNPKSMSRLMNIVYITGRLLKAFQIEFHW